MIHRNELVKIKNKSKKSIKEKIKKINKESWKWIRSWYKWFVHLENQKN